MTNMKADMPKSTVKNMPENIKQNILENIPNNIPEEFEGKSKSIENKILRVLVVLPLYGGSLPIGQYCIDALKELGHTVEFFDAPRFFDAYVAIQSLNISSERKNALEQSYTQMLSQAVYAMAESFEPNLIFAMAQAPLTRSILNKLKNDKIPTAMWFVEDHSLFVYWKAFAHLYDFFFTIQKDPFLSLLEQAGVKNAAYLPLAALPHYHEHKKLSREEKNMYASKLSFMGAGYPNRRLAFRSLIKHDFKIWGSDWNGDDLLAKYLQKNGKRIESDETLLIYNATDINLNLHSSVHTKNLVSKGDFVNPRTFELASIGAFQLVDKRGLMDELFITGSLKNPQENAELATFESLEELQENITYYLAHSEERERIAKRAQERILKEHTYAHRMQDMLNFVSSRLADSPDWTDWSGWKNPSDQQEESAWPEGISPELSEEMKELLESLNLPLSCDFKTLITRIRTQSGILSDLETSLLFLEEWQKQYGIGSSK